MASLNADPLLVLFAFFGMLVESLLLGKRKIYKYK